jgi:hypothetical protein
MFIHHALTPWVCLVDPARYAAEVNRVHRLGMTTIALPTVLLSQPLAWRMPSLCSVACRTWPSRPRRTRRRSTRSSAPS